MRLLFACLMLACLAFAAGCRAKCDDCGDNPLPAKVDEAKAPAPAPAPTPKVKRRPVLDGEISSAVQSAVNDIEVVDDGSTVIPCVVYRSGPADAGKVPPDQWPAAVIERVERMRDEDAERRGVPRPPRYVWWLTHRGLLDPASDVTYPYPPAVRRLYGIAE